MKKRIVRICCCVAAAVLIVCGVLYGASAASVTVTDPQLRAALQTRLNTSEITAAQMETLTDLDLSGKGIADLTGLEAAKNLKTLALRGNRVTDLSPLAGLISLETLDLDGNQVTSLAPLSGLNNLRVLHLTDNEVSDLTPVAKLRMLQFVFCAQNRLNGTVAAQTVEAMRFRGVYLELGTQKDPEPTESQPESKPESQPESQPEAPAALTLKSGSTMKLDASTRILTGIAPGTAISALYDQLDYGGYTLRLRNSAGESVSQSEIGTGMVIQMVRDDDTVVDQVTALVYGDVNGDGSIDVVDIAVLRKDLKSGGKNLSGIYKTAGNLAAHNNNDSSDDAIDVVDLAVLRKYLMGSLDIRQ